VHPLADARKSALPRVLRPAPSSRSSRSRLARSGAFAFGLTALVACASSTERAPFVDEPPAPPASEPEQSATPAKIPQSEPARTESDASLTPDAPDTCKRTAPSNKCGLVPQCGCTLAETCDVDDASGSVACVTAGKAVMGAPCIGTEGCAVGLTCVFGTCHAFCDNPGSACGTPKTAGCFQVKATGGAAIPNLKVCAVACDLRDATACGGTTAAGTGVCMVDDKGGTDCVKGGTRTVGQVCTPTDDCGPTLVCTLTGTATSGNCRKWCRVGTNDCGGTTACNGFSTKVMVGTVEYGACP
jgi:hypothetical protein